MLQLVQNEPRENFRPSATSIGFDAGAGTIALH